MAVNAPHEPSRPVSGWKALCFLAAMMLTTTLLTACAPSSTDARSSITKQITLTPDSPIAEAIFSFGTNHVEATSGTYFDTADPGSVVNEDRKLSFSFNPPTPTPISITSDSAFTFESITNEESGTDVTSIFTEGETTKSVQFALPKGSNETVDFELTIEAAASSNFSDIVVDLTVDIETGATYDSAIGIPVVNGSSTTRHSVHLSSPEILAGEGLAVENYTYRGSGKSTVAYVVDETATAVPHTEPIFPVNEECPDGGCEPIPDINTIIPWPEECLRGPCNTTIDIYIRNDSIFDSYHAKSSYFALTSPDPQAELAVISEPSDFDAFP